MRRLKLRGLQSADVSYVAESLGEAMQPDAQVELRIGPGGFFASMLHYAPRTPEVPFHS